MARMSMSWVDMMACRISFWTVVSYSISKRMNGNILHQWISVSVHLALLWSIRNTFIPLVDMTVNKDSMQSKDTTSKMDLGNYSMLNWSSHSQTVHASVLRKIKSSYSVVASALVSVHLLNKLMWWHNSGNLYQLCLKVET